MAVRLSALRTGRTLLPRNIIILMFPVLISVKRLSKPQGLVRAEGLGKFKNSPAYIIYGFFMIGAGAAVI
jgi:hypothetical protein